MGNILIVVVLAAVIVLAWAVSRLSNQSSATQVMTARPSDPGLTFALFVAAGIPGAVALIAGTGLIYEGFRVFNYAMVAGGIAASAVGAVLILAGSGRWGQWAYLMIFAAFIGVMSLMFVVARPSGIGEKGCGPIVYGGLAALVTSVGVNLYYALRRRRAGSASGGT